MVLVYLHPADVTPSMQLACEALLVDHADDPWGTEIPITVDQVDLVARVERHYNAPGGSSNTPACAHTGISLLLEDGEREPTSTGIVRRFSLGNASQRKLLGLDPRLASMVSRAIEITDVDFFVLEGLRTPDRHRKLFEMGFTERESTPHTTGHAVDLVPWVMGQPSYRWEDFQRLARFILRAAIDVECPIQRGGNWSKLTQQGGPHWQIPRGL